MAEAPRLEITKDTDVGIEIFNLGSTHFTAFRNGNTFLSAGALDMKIPIKSVIVQYDFFSETVRLLFGTDDLTRRNADYVKLTAATSACRMDALTIEQHKKLIDFFKKAEYFKADVVRAGDINSKYEKLKPQLECCLTR